MILTCQKGGVQFFPIIELITENKNFLAGLNVYRGNITFKGVSDAFDLKYTPASELLKN